MLDLASEIAKEQGRDQVRAGDILRGLLQDGQGVGAILLKNLDLEMGRMLRELEKRLKRGEGAQDAVTSDVIAQTVKEAKSLNHNYLGTEHLLLALIRDTGVAGSVLHEFGVTYEVVRDDLVALHGGPEPLTPVPLRQPDCPLCCTINNIQSSPALIAELQWTYAVLSENQGPKGWCVLLLKSHIEHFGDFSRVQQLQIFADVTRMCAAIRTVFPTSGKDGGPPRINYECLGNLVPHVHWHIIPRHGDDPYPTKAVWVWPEEEMRGAMSEGERVALIEKIRDALWDVNP